MWSPLFFGLLFVWLSESKVEGKHLCFKDCDHGFSKAHQKLLRSLISPRHPPAQPVHHPAGSCEDFVRTASDDLKHRSLSPWRTRTVENPDMYPSKYEEAQCLCDGCIINGELNRSYNSVPVFKTHVFLKKHPCPSDPDKYSFTFEHVQVPVACTCAVPKQ